MVKELVASSLDQAEIRDYDPADPGRGEIRIRSQFGAMKHGTELAGLAGYAGARGRFDSELQLFMSDDSSASTGDARPIGNMVVGTVVAVGDGVEGFKLGETVTAHAPLREEQTVSGERCWSVPETVSWQSAVCLDPAQFALGAIRDGNVRVGDAVAVFGLGAIGLMAVQIARTAGASTVIGVDLAENRRGAAISCGADVAIDPVKVDAGLEIKQLTGNRGVDVAVEYSGATAAMQSALRGVAFGGNVVAGAFPPPYGAGLDFGAEAHLNRPNIVFSRAVSDPNRDHPRWDQRRIFEECWTLFENGSISGDLVVDPVVSFNDSTEAFTRVMNDPSAGIKLGCVFD